LLDVAAVLCLDGRADPERGELAFTEGSKTRAWIRGVVKA
jgi:hypothetical protein